MSPSNPNHRRYEGLRAYLLEGLPAAEASANPPGTQQNAGSFFMTKFQQLLTQLTAPPMRLPRPISTYSL